MNRIVIMLVVGIWSIKDSRSQSTPLDTAFWQYQISLSARLQAGNDERTELRNRIYSYKVNPHWGWRSTIFNFYKMDFGNKLENETRFLNLIYRKPLSSFHLFQLTWLEHNFRRQIEFRFQLGLGIEHLLVTKSNFNLAASLAIGYESTNFGVSDFVNFENIEQRHVIDLWRAAFRVGGRYTFPNSKLRLRFEGWIQPSLLEKENYRYHLTTGLTLPILGKLALQSNLDYSYENVIVRGFKHNDLLYTFGLSFSNF